MFNKFMLIALEEAKIAQNVGEIPVGAVIVKDETIIARAHNLKETTKNATAHAEILAIAKAGKVLNKWQLDDCKLYVTLQPCDMCKAAITQSRLSAVYFGAYDKDFDFVLKNTQVYGGIMEEECTKILNDFFKKIR